jgi:hypothetical protein
MGPSAVSRRCPQLNHFRTYNSVTLSLVECLFPAFSRPLCHRLVTPPQLILEPESLLPGPCDDPFGLTYTYNLLANLPDRLTIHAARLKWPPEILITHPRPMAPPSSCTPFLCCQEAQATMTHSSSMVRSTQAVPAVTSK